MSYSLWIIPADPAVKAYFDTVVADLAKRYDGPIFEPHTTVLGDQNLALSDIDQRLTPVMKPFTPFMVETGSVEYSTTYYQCVFVRLKPTPALMALYDTVKKALEVTAPSVFMPHVSLFYGNVPYDRRQHIIDTFTLAPQRYTVNRLIVTPGGEHPPSEWTHDLEIAFNS